MQALWQSGVEGKLHVDAKMLQMLSCLLILRIGFCEAPKFFEIAICHHIQAPGISLHQYVPVSHKIQDLQGEETGT